MAALQEIVTSLAKEQATAEGDEPSVQAVQYQLWRKPDHVAVSCLAVQCRRYSFRGMHNSRSQ